MTKTKKTKKLKIKLTKAAEAAIKKEAEAFKALTFAKQKKAFTVACNASEHSPEVALLVALGRQIGAEYEDLLLAYKCLDGKLNNAQPKRQ